VFGNWDYGILRVAATGGIPDTLTEAWVLAADKPDYQQILPQILPDGESVLFTVNTMTANNRVEVLSLETLERRVVIERGRHGRYVNTGHIVYALGGDMLAVPFDLEKLEVLGPSIPLEEGVAMGYMGSAQMAISDNGTLVFANGDMPFTRNRLVWVDKDGSVDTLSVPPGNYMQARVSHDETRLLISRVEDRYSLWAYDLVRGTLGPLTDDEADEAWAIWTPSGNEIVSNTNRTGGNAMNLAWIRVGEEGEFEALASSPNNQFPFSWTPDGTVLAFGQLKSPTEGFDMDIWMLPLSGDSTPYPFLANSWDETHAAFSPDGRWIAYASNESGRYEIYVRPFPSGGTRNQVSINGGMEPVWAPDGRELYFRDHLVGKQVLAVPVDADGRITGVPRTLFEGSYVATGYRLGRSYDIAPDGSRFLMVAQPSQVSVPPSEFKVVVNWFSELLIRVPR